MVVAIAAAALAVLLLHASPAVEAAGQKKPATAARREDVPYIRCQVCERIAREISAQVAKKQQALPPSKKVLFLYRCCCCARGVWFSGRILSRLMSRELCVRHCRCRRSRDRKSVV